MKMVINQLEGILIELKDVAKELREVRFSLYITEFWGALERNRGGRDRENMGAGWVCYSSRLHLIKCKIPFAVWRF